MDARKIYSICHLLLADYESLNILLYLQQISLGVHAGYPRIKEERPDIYVEALEKLTDALPASATTAYPFDHEDVNFLESIGGIDKFGLNLLARVNQLVTAESHKNPKEIEALQVFKSEFESFVLKITNIRDSLSELFPSNTDHNTKVKIYFPEGIIQNTPSDIYSEIRKHNNYFKIVTEASGLEPDDVEVVEIKQGSIAITLSTLSAVGAALAIIIERIMKLQLMYLDIRIKREKLESSGNKSEKADAPGTVLGKLSELAITHMSADSEAMEIIKSIENKLKEKYNEELEREIVSLYSQYLESKNQQSSDRKNELSTGYKQFVKHISARVTRGAIYSVEFPQKDLTSDDIEALSNISYKQLQEKGALLVQYRLMDKVVEPIPQKLLENK